MEEMDGLFSSPEKSPAKLNGFGNAVDDDSVGSEMSMDEGAQTTTAPLLHV
jgi:centromere protein C